MVLLREGRGEIGKERQRGRERGWGGGREKVTSRKKRRGFIFPG